MPNRCLSSDRAAAAQRRRAAGALGALAALMAAVLAVPASAHPVTQPREPRLVGRAVLPVETYAPGPPAGAFYTGRKYPPITLPTPSQPVEGFSAVVAGRKRGEYLTLADNGFGSKANSPDFLLRAYYLTPHFKTARDGSGGVDVNGYIEFRDPRHELSFPIVNEATQERLLTGADLDPESMQVDRKGDLWVGDEFGPWILHFSPSGVLLDPPIGVPGFESPDNPMRTEAATQPSSRGFEGMAISPNRKYLYAAFEGASVADQTADPLRRTIHEFSIRDKAFTGRSWQYRADAANHLISDMAALDRHRILVLSRDSLRGEAIVFRSAYVVDLRKTDQDGYLLKDRVVDLTSIPDPDLISLPAIHEGDVRIGDPFAVVCLSIEIAYRISGTKFLFGCDNNFPDNGRNPALADDSEFIVVDIPAVVR